MKVVTFAREPQSSYYTTAQPLARPLRQLFRTPLRQGNSEPNTHTTIKQIPEHRQAGSSNDGNNKTQSMQAERVTLFGGNPPGVEHTSSNAARIHHFRGHCRLPHSSNPSMITTPPLPPNISAVETTYLEHRPI
ncbi:unnamed protein product, partial [Ectocarpus sp. 6 AP-2014]